jgi:hypothetical protein
LTSALTSRTVSTTTPTQEVTIMSNTRPVAALPYQTQRDYALKARSPKCLTEEVNAILTAAGEGEAVDVYDFLGAATAALSLAATRAGQSMARREWTKEARALIHWADAIIRNHLDGLPAYAEGDRSRAVEAAKDGLRAAREEVYNLSARIASLIQEKSDVEIALDEARHAALAAITRAEAAERTADAKIDRNVFNYVWGFLSPTQRSQTRGFVDGVEGAALPTEASAI